MDKNIDILKNFELILKENASNQLPNLYSGNKHEIPGNIDSELSLTVDRVICNVSKQIKAIQSADCRSNVKSNAVNINKYKKSKFIPVDLLDGVELIPQNTNLNLETQCVTDTELVNIVQYAEDSVSHRGMTQEFNTTFGTQDRNISLVQIVTDNDESKNVESDKMRENNLLNNKEPIFPIIDISLKEPDRSDDFGSLFDEEDKNNEEVCTEIENQAPVDMFENIHMVDKKETQTNSDRIELSSSPVFNVKSVKKSITLTPMVFELEAFEEFEKLAIPIVEKYNDQETAKCCINSQILGKELWSHLESSPVLYEDEQNQVSPVVEYSHNKFTFDHAVEYLPKKDKSAPESKSTQGSILKDEILFSSDEENECGLQEYDVEDLPFTCALATSFYEQPHVLDKTMYVGFQTASNKSIQICTESFYKAKSILDDSTTNASEKSSLTELVQICEQNFTASKESIEYVNSVTNVCRDAIEFVDTEYDNNTTCEQDSVNQLFKLRELSEKCVKTIQTFEGFKTASNKKIYVSEKGLQQSKKIFNDIDITENYNFEIPVQEMVKDKKELNLDESILLEFENNDMSHNTLDIYKTADLAEFKTASNKNNKILDTDLEKSKTIFLNIESHNCVDDTRATNAHLIEHLKQSNPGFKTASNKEIKISDQAMAKTKSLFSDIELLDSKNIDFGRTEIKLSKDIWHQPTISENPFAGFKTASNKKIEISHDALIKTKKVFEDISSYNIVGEKNICFAKSKPKYPNEFTNKRKFDDIDDTPSNSECTSNDFIGFHTPSDKRIKICKEALMKTRKIFEGIEIDTIDKDDESTYDMATNISITQPKGSQSANKKPITISEEAMEKSRVILKRIPGVIDDNHSSSKSSTYFTGFPTTSNKCITETEQAFLKINKSVKNIDSDTVTKIIKNDNSLKGFKTASNKFITVSEDALARSKRVFENVDDIEEETPFRGFQTAKYININKKVEISNDALNKSKKLFENIDLENETIQNTNKDSFQGFRTASNKKVNISKTALARSREIFENIDLETEPIENINKNSFQGFQTASNKKVNVSETAMAISKEIFENIDHKTELIENINKNSFQGFQTASNKKVNISETALARSRKIFENIDLETEPIENINKNSFQGFQTASNKKVNISETALSRSRKIFENIDLESEPIENLDKDSFQGFQTASNKKVNISETALARSRKIFENIDLESEPIENLDKDSFQGFQTASNKKVNISETALARSSKIFENIDLETKPIEYIHKGSFQGFQTARNKKVNISETASASIKTILKYIKTDSKVDGADIPNSNEFQTFKTGNNKKVNISNQAFAKTRKCVDSHPDDKYLFESPRGSTFKGFQTGNNKEVKVYKEDFTKTKSIFQDINGAFKNADNCADLAISQVIPVKSVYNSAKKYSKTNLTASACKKRDNHRKSDRKEDLVKNVSAHIIKDSFNIGNVIDTQVVNDFDKSLHTEDFSKAITPVKSKRSGSPILSCPKAKRRKKFETPYCKMQKTIVDPDVIEDINKNDTLQTYNFDKTYKKSKKYNLSDIYKMEKDSTYSIKKIDPYILTNNFENLLRFEFFGKRNELSNKRWTTSDLKEYFLNSVNKKFVPDGWIDNHLKLIIWKLISYEIKFPETLGVVCTSKNVIDQLKYRYDKELFNSERPALRKIMEKDDVSTKLMVLCIAAIYEDGADVDKVPNKKNVELLLTDGWYCIRACLDRMLSKLVADGKIAVGSKIVTSGAELVGCDQGIAPWEDTTQVRLKLFGNSTRRARWLARLGYHGNGAILSHLRDVRPDGGRVARLRVFVARVYPTLYIEKFDDGSTVTRSERLELLHQMKHENERQGLLEKLYEEMQKEFSYEESQESEVDPELKRRWTDSGSQIAKAMKKSRDPAEFKLNLTETQVELLNDFTTKKRDRLIQNMQARVEERMAESGLNVSRNVVPLMKIRIAGVREGENIDVTRGLMSIWKPNEAITEIVKEGAWIEAMGVTPTALRCSEIQISAGRQSIFREWKNKESSKVKPYIKSMKRICYTIKDLTKNPSMATDYNEIDTVGLIFLIEPPIKEFDSNKNQFQNVYLSDADKNMICVNFWRGLKKLGFENILDVGQVVACMNLQKRAGNTRKNIPQYRVTEFSYFTKTPKHESARNLCEELDKKLQAIDRLKFCNECVTLKNNYLAFKIQSYNENVSPYRCLNIDLNLSKNKMFFDSPLVGKSGRNEENLNLSGLDFESTFKQVNTQEYSPKTLLRKRQIKEKIDKLKMYGEPPALSPMQILNKSKNAGSAYKSPLTKCDVSKSVAISSDILLKEKNVESTVPGSPVLMNKTFVNRSNINPVKLDFNSVAIDESNVNDSIDHFAEAIDGSPPLSLD